MVSLAEAQQALSEKFKIPTFDISGGISTVPTTGKIGSINVGVGKFGGETISSFTSGLNQIITGLKQTGGKIGSTQFKRPRPKSSSQQTGSIQGGEAIPDSFQFRETFDEGLSGVSNFLQSNPTLLIVGLGLIALTVLRK